MRGAVRTCIRSTQTKNVRKCSLYSDTTSASQSIKITRIVSETSRRSMTSDGRGCLASTACSLAKSRRSVGPPWQGAVRRCTPWGRCACTERQSLCSAAPALSTRTANGSRPSLQARARHGAKNSCCSACAAVVRAAGLGVSSIASISCASGWPRSAGTIVSSGSPSLTSTPRRRATVSMRSTSPSRASSSSKPGHDSSVGRPSFSKMSESWCRASSTWFSNTEPFSSSRKSDCPSSISANRQPADHMSTAVKCGPPRLPASVSGARKCAAAQRCRCNCSCISGVEAGMAMVKSHSLTCGRPPAKCWGRERASVTWTLLAAPGEPRQLALALVLALGLLLAALLGPAPPELAEALTGSLTGCASNSDSCASCSKEPNWTGGGGLPSDRPASFSSVPSVKQAPAPGALLDGGAEAQRARFSDSPRVLCGRLLSHGGGVLSQRRCILPPAARRSPLALSKETMTCFGRSLRCATPWWCATASAVSVSKMMSRASSSGKCPFSSSTSSRLHSPTAVSMLKVAAAALTAPVSGSCRGSSSVLRFASRTPEVPATLRCDTSLSTATSRSKSSGKPSFVRRSTSRRTFMPNRAMSGRRRRTAALAGGSVASSSLAGAVGEEAASTFSLLLLLLLLAAEGVHLRVLLRTARRLLPLTPPLPLPPPPATAGRGASSAGASTSMRRAAHHWLRPPSRPSPPAWAGWRGRYGRGSFTKPTAFRSGTLRPLSQRSVMERSSMSCATSRQSRATIAMRPRSASEQNVRTWQWTHEGTSRKPHQAGWPASCCAASSASSA